MITIARWIIRENDANINLMAQTLDISPILCEVLANRGIRTKHAAIKYLNPQPGYMHDAAAMQGIGRAAEIVFDAIAEGKRFCIYGDYDVDGISATVILHKALTALGGRADYYIPHREREGYGLNIPAIEKIAETADVIITVDNGIASLDETARAKALGLAVIIIDHHQPPYAEDAFGTQVEELPPADAIINPKQAACGYPFKEMCAAALAYKFAEYLHKIAERPYVGREEAVIFAAIASFCDVVDLVDENRIIAATGLSLLNRGAIANTGLNALVLARNLTYNKIGAFDIGFVIGPCINASGRLDSAMLGVELFVCQDDAKAAELADKLVQLNDERKDMCALFVEKTIEGLSGKTQQLDKVLVLYEPDIHESIAGIVAGRVKDALNRPTIVLSKASGMDGDVAKGSARSIEHYNIFEEMQKCKDLFVRFGGHKMAAGVSLAAENIDVLRERLNTACALTDDDFVPNIYIDKVLTLEDVTFELAQSLDLLAPFGKENKQPLFATYGIHTESAEIIGQSGATMRLGFRLASGRRLRAVAFKSVDKFAAMLAESYSDEVCQNFLHGRIRNMTVKMDIAYHVEINEYNGNSSLQLRIVDFVL